MSASRFNILILDSNAFDAQRIEALLRRAFSTGVEICRALDVQAARAQLAVGDIHLAIADVAIHPFKGAAIVEELRQISPGMPVICVAGERDSGLSLAVMAAGAAMFIDKRSLDDSDEPLTRAVVSVLAEARQRVRESAVLKQIQAMHQLMHQMHGRLEIALAAMEQHESRIRDNAGRLLSLTGVVRAHERQRRQVLAMLWALATAVVVALTQRMF